MITDENHKKLSKRSGHASYEDLIEQGFLPEAVVNYLALLGWSPEDNREIFSLDELIKEFDYHKVNKSPSVFDIQMCHHTHACPEFSGGLIQIFYVFRHHGRGDGFVST